MAPGSRAAVRFPCFVLLACVFAFLRVVSALPHHASTYDTLQLRSANPIPIEDIEYVELSNDANRPSEAESKGFFSDLGRFLGDYTGIDIFRDFFKSVLKGGENGDDGEDQEDGDGGNSTTVESSSLSTLYGGNSSSTGDASPTTLSTGDESTLTPSGIAEKIISEILAEIEATITSTSSVASSTEAGRARIRTRTAAEEASTSTTTSTSSEEVSVVTEIPTTWSIPASESGIIFSILPIIPGSSNGTASLPATAVPSTDALLETAVPTTTGFTALESDIVFSILPVIPVSSNGSVVAPTGTSAPSMSSELPAFRILPVTTETASIEPSDIQFPDGWGKTRIRNGTEGTGVPSIWIANTTSEKPWILTNPLRPTSTSTISDELLELIDSVAPIDADTTVSGDESLTSTQSLRPIETEPTDAIDWILTSPFTSEITETTSSRPWILTNPLRPTTTESWNATVTLNETSTSTAWMTSTSTLFVTVTGDLPDTDEESTLLPEITALPTKSGAPENRLVMTDAPFGPYSTVSDAEDEEEATATASSSYTSTIPLLFPFPSPVHSNESVSNITTAPGLSSLRRICQDPEIKTITLPLIKHFYGPNSYPSLNRFPGCTTANSRQALQAPGLLDCSMLGEEILKCQKTGRRVLLSIKGDGMEAVQGNTDYGKPGVSLQPFGAYFKDIGRGNGSGSEGEIENDNEDEGEDPTNDNTNQHRNRLLSDDEDDASSKQVELNANSHGENDKTHKKTLDAETENSSDDKKLHSTTTTHHRRSRPWNNTFKPIPNLFTESRPPSSLALTLFSLFGEGHTERADLRPFGPDTPSSVSPECIEWSNTDSNTDSNPDSNPNANANANTDLKLNVNRPLGEEVVVDGFDVQLPSEWRDKYQAERFEDLVTRLRELHEEAWKEVGGDKGKGGAKDLGADGKGVVYFDFV